MIDYYQKFKEFNREQIPALIDMVVEFDLDENPLIGPHLKSTNDTAKLLEQDVENQQLFEITCRNLQLLKEAIRPLITEKFLFRHWIQKHSNKDIAFGLCRSFGLNEETLKIYILFS